VRVPIPIPRGVLLCAYKLGFGLAQKLLEKFQNSLILGSRDTALCIVPCSGLASGGSASVQSGVHWTVSYSLSGVPLGIELGLLFLFYPYYKEGLWMSSLTRR
jgi:hypothetical protein